MEERRCIHQDHCLRSSSDSSQGNCTTVCLEYYDNRKDAQSAIDTIQAATERRNRAMTEPHPHPQPDYATEQPPDCVRIQTSDCCGNRWCGMGWADNTGLPSFCSTDECSDYTTALPQKVEPTTPWPPPPPSESSTRESGEFISPALLQSEQLRQMRPFVHVDDVLIFLDDFVAFDIHQDRDFVAWIRGLNNINMWAKLVIFVSRWDCDTKSNLMALDKAQAALNTIQAAIEYWNRAATEPEQKQLLTIREQQEVVGYIKWRCGSASEPDWNNVSTWLIELEEHRPGSPIAKRKEVEITFDEQLKNEGGIRIYFPCGDSRIIKKGQYDKFRIKREKKSIILEGFVPQYQWDNIKYFLWGKRRTYGKVYETCELAKKAAQIALNTLNEWLMVDAS